MKIGIHGKKSDKNSSANNIVLITKKTILKIFIAGFKN
jgi:hypothetical protein